MDLVNRFQTDVMDSIDAHAPERKATLTLHSTPMDEHYLMVSVRGFDDKEVNEVVPRRGKGFLGLSYESLTPLFERGAKKARELMNAVEDQSYLRAAYEDLRPESSQYLENDGLNEQRALEADE